MKYRHRIKYIEKDGELWPADFSADFPYVGYFLEIHNAEDGQNFWHWHKAVTIFYVEKGTLEINTPVGKSIFPAGSGGFINSDVIHKYQMGQDTECIVRLHLFDASFLSGQYGSKIEQKFIVPLLTAPHVEIIKRYPENREHIDFLENLSCSFLLSENDFAYEIRLRAALSELWCDFLKNLKLAKNRESTTSLLRCKIKKMLRYIWLNYSEKITIFEIAEASGVSTRECFRIFHDCLHTTPMNYLKEYRIQKACRMLAESNLPLAEISAFCGIGRNCYFSKIFQEVMGCTPVEYRKKWQHYRNI